MHLSCWSNTGMKSGGTPQSKIWIKTTSILISYAFHMGLGNIHDITAECPDRWWRWRHFGFRLQPTVSISFQPEGICKPIRATPTGKGLSVSTVLWTEWLGCKGIQGSVLDRKRKSLTDFEGVHVTFVTSLQTIIVKIPIAVAWNLAKTGG